MARKWALAFSVLLGLGLAVSVPWLLAVWTDNGSSNVRIALVVIMSVLVAVGFSIVLLLLYHLVTVKMPRLLHRFAVWVTFKTVQGAIARQRLEVELTAIASIEGDLRVSLPVGLRNGLAIGERFLVVNSASHDAWGELEVAEIEEISCVCSVYNRNNPEFWDALDARMNHDPSPPQGVIARLDIPEEFLIDWLLRLLRPAGG